MNGTDYDVVIIGGGPAGSVAGINLARAGIKTAIIERKNFPRDTLCGEFLSFEVTNHLRELNLLEKFLLLKPNKINSFRLITQNNKVFNSDLPFDGYSLPRPVFDTFLLNEVKAAGAEIIQPAEVVGIDQENENPVLNIKTHIDCKNISANFIIGAYGKTNMLDKQLKRKFITRHSVYTGIKFHLSKENFSSICDSVIYIFSGNNIYCGVNTVNPDQVTICFLFKKNKIIKESPSELFQKLLIENRNFCSLFNDRININDHTLYGAGNIYFGKKELTYGKILMIGDAAGMIAPVAGDGIGMAFQSAKIAAKVIQNNFDNLNRVKINNIYNAEWKKQFNRRLILGRLIQNIIFKNYPGKAPYVFTQLLLPVFINATRN